jgi:20S proteasome subunit alpha 5
MTLNEAELLALRTLKQSMEEKITSLNVEVAVIPVETSKFTVYSQEQVDELLGSIENLQSSLSSST